MGSMAMGECRNSQRKSCIAQRNCKHIEGGYGRLSLGDVYTCHGIPSRTCKFKETNSITFFHKFITRFVDKRLGFPWQPLINRIYATQ
jgi:hypothetical protein